MTQNAKLVSSSKPNVKGAVSRGPFGTPLPNGGTERDAALKSLGYIGEAGIKMKSDRKSDKTRAFGGDVVNVAQTEFGEVWTFTLIESRNAEVLKTVYGEANVTITPGTAPDGSDTKIHIAHNSQELPHSAWVLDVITRGGIPRTITIADGFISDVGDVTYADKDIIAYQVSIDALPDEDGNCSNEYIG